MIIIIINWLHLLSSSQALQVVAKCCKPSLAPSMYANVTDAIIPLPLLTKPVTCSVVSIVYSSPAMTSPTSELMMMQNYLQLKTWPQGPWAKTWPFAKWCPWHKRWWHHSGSPSQETSETEKSSSLPGASTEKKRAKFRPSKASWQPTEMHRNDQIEPNSLVKCR